MAVVRKKLKRPEPMPSDWALYHRKLVEGKVKDLSWTCAKIDPKEWASDFADNYSGRSKGLYARDLHGKPGPFTSDLKTLKDQLYTARQEAHAKSQQDKDHKYAVILSMKGMYSGPTIYGLDSIWKEGEKLR